MANAKNVGRPHQEDALMRLMQSELSLRPAKLYDAYRTGGWLSVHDAALEMLRIAEREKNDAESDELARALGDILEYMRKGYGLGRCSYLPPDPIPKGTSSKEIEEYEQRGILLSREATELDEAVAKYSSHYFLSASARRVPKWCPDHNLAARQRTLRKKKLRQRRSGKYT